MTSLYDDVPTTEAQEAEAQGDQSEEVQVALQKLAPKYRDALVIHYLQGKSCAETAEILGVKPVTARIRLLRGRQQLAKILRQDGAV